MTSSDTIAEKNRQYHRARSEFVRHLPGGEVYEGKGVTTAAGGVRWAAMNNAFLLDPVKNEQDLRRRIAIAQEFFATRHLEWRFTVCTDWLGACPKSLVDSIFEEHGLSPKRELKGMVAEALLEPVRPLPKLRFRDQASLDARRAFARINATCHAVPEAWITEIVVPDALWTGEFLGYIGEVEETPVTAALVGVVEKAIYVGWVATLPAWQRLGCAEAIVRHALGVARERFAVEKTFLHASSRSACLFGRMGYSPVTTFKAYSTS